MGKIKEYRHKHIVVEIHEDKKGKKTILLGHANINTIGYMTFTLREARFVMNMLFAILFNIQETEDED